MDSRCTGCHQQVPAGRVRPGDGIWSGDRPGHWRKAYSRTLRRTEIREGFPLISEVLWSGTVVLVGLDGDKDVYGFHGRSCKCLCQVI